MHVFPAVAHIGCTCPNQMHHDGVGKTANFKVKQSDLEAELFILLKAFF